MASRHSALWPPTGGAYHPNDASVDALASRLRFPALILFLRIGMLTGSDGFGWIDLVPIGFYWNGTRIGACTARPDQPREPEPTDYLLYVLIGS